MKPFLLILALFSVSCATRKVPPVIKVTPSANLPLKQAEARAIRLPEHIKAYPLGRYADPNHRGIMHEAHTLYRVEATPKWNLAGRAGSPPPVASLPPRSTEPSRNELQVELSRQREATKAVMQSGETVTTKLTDLATSLQRNQQTLAEQNAGLREELRATRERIESLEQRVESPPVPAPASEPDDEPW